MTKDNPSNNKGGGVGIYFKEFLAAREVGLITWMNTFSVRFASKKWYIGSLYRLPSPMFNESGDLLLNFEYNLCDVIVRNPLFVLVHGEEMIWQPVKVLILTHFLLLSVLLRLHLIQLIFSQILHCALTLFFQTNLT